jgi:hypothetical protein
MFTGYQTCDVQSLQYPAVAVRSGDVLREVGTVPEPQSLALVVSALAVLSAAIHRHRTA